MEITLLASIAISNLVEIEPVCNGTGISFSIPWIFILLPGVVRFSILKSTRSSFRKTLILLGCSPPSRVSGDSSITNLWASTISLLNNLKLPFQPHEHLDGSWNFLSIWRTERIAPQFGHSNLAFTTWGLTSEAWRIIPSTVRILSRCFALIALMGRKELFGSYVTLTRGFFSERNSDS